MTAAILSFVLLMGAVASMPVLSSTCGLEHCDETAAAPGLLQFNASAGNGILNDENQEEENATGLVQTSSHYPQSKCQNRWSKKQCQEHKNTIEDWCAKDWRSAWACPAACGFCNCDPQKRPCRLGQKCHDQTKICEFEVGGYVFLRPPIRNKLVSEWFIQPGEKAEVLATDGKGNLALKNLDGSKKKRIVSPLTAQTDFIETRECNDKENNPANYCKNHLNRCSNHDGWWEFRTLECPASCGFCGGEPQWGDSVKLL